MKKEKKNLFKLLIQKDIWAKGDSGECYGQRALCTLLPFGITSCSELLTSGNMNTTNSCVVLYASLNCVQWYHSK